MGRQAQMFTAKALLLATGVLSTTVLLRLSAPAVSAFFCSEVPQVYGALHLWLTPPYLYFLINGIIISIAASSRFQMVVPEEEGVEAVPASPAVKAYADDPRPPVVFEVGEGPEAAEVGPQDGFLLSAKGYGGGKGDFEGRMVVLKETAVAAAADDEKFVIPRSSWTPKMRDSWKIAPAPEFGKPPTGKPLVSMRFGGRWGFKAIPEAKSLGVAKPKKYETLESTWKTITDGGPMPLARQLKKSDTWGADGGGHGQVESQALAPMRKAVTFNERRVTSPSPLPSGSGGSGRLGREPSLGRDELNRRVEAFINKFNEEMRLQRQESFKHYMEMVNRGSHERLIRKEAEEPGGEKTEEKKRKKKVGHGERSA